MTVLSQNATLFLSYTIFEKVFEIALAYNIIKPNLYFLSIVFIHLSTQPFGLKFTSHLFILVFFGLTTKSETLIYYHPSQKRASYDCLFLLTKIVFFIHIYLNPAISIEI